MKKTTLALAIALAGVTSAAQAAPNDNTWYTGAKVGWSQYHDVNSYEDAGYSKAKRHSVGAGAFAGYQANPYIGFEVGYDYLGKINYKYDGAEDDVFRSQGVQLTAKLGYPITEKLDIYSRVGGMVWWAQGKDKSDNERVKKTGVSPVFAGGFEYALTDSLATRLEYQWVNNIGDGEKIGVRPDNAMVSFGMAYRFGQGAAPVIAPMETKPEIITKHFELKSDVLFGFGKQGLKPQGEEALDQMFEQLKNINPTNGSIVVYGYSDRIGSAKYNQKLSQLRAQSVVNHLIGKGVPADSITAKGMGQSNPVTGSTCDKVKPRAKLIECLAPDRRVDIEVTGTLEVVN